MNLEETRVSILCRQKMLLLSDVFQKQQFWLLIYQYKMIIRESLSIQFSSYRQKTEQDHLIYFACTISFKKNSLSLERC